MPCQDADGGHALAGAVTRSISSAKPGAVCPGSFLWRKDFLNTDSVNEVLATQVNQVSSSAHW